MDTEVQDLVQLVSKESVIEEFGEAVASTVVPNSNVTWAKFIFTDDKPNANRQRVPIEEFDNILKTGPYKPVKMALGEIKDGHEDAKPIGVITNLVKDGNKIVGLAALWNHERTDDIATIKDRFDSNKPINVSWELLYGSAKVNNGVSDLYDIVVKAVTIVGMPAYAGRTQFLAVAAKKWSQSYIDSLPDTSFMRVEADGKRYFAFRDDTGKIDPSRFPVILEELATASLPQNTLKGIKHQVTKLNTMISADASVKELLEAEGLLMEDTTLDTKELESKVTELSTKLAEASELIVAKETELKTAKAEADLAKEKVESLEAELTPLRDFKAEADKLAERQVKLAAIKEKFSGLGLDKEETYFEENADKLLGLDESGLDFMLQEMVAFKDTGEGQASAKKQTSGVPNIPGKKTDLVSDPRELGKLLAESRKSNNK